MERTAITFNVQHFSTEDGPGIRTTIFLKGCLLQCAWCHNPEGLSARPELVWHDVRCVGVRECLRACPESALSLEPGGMRIDRERCNVCGACAEACPSGALEVIGCVWTAHDLLEELVKDRAFYETSGGGITFSGGEPMMQALFLAEALSICRQEGLHVALDTCGAVPWEWFERVLPLVDLVLLDLKLIDPSRHETATGLRSDGILDNARRMAGLGMRMWIRTPVIPGYTSDSANLHQIGTFIVEELPTVERWDLLAYTNLGRPKYHRLDRPYQLDHVPLMARDEMEGLWREAVKLVPVTHWSGATR